MTAHTIQGSDITTPSNMMFNEMISKYLPEKSSTIETDNSSDSEEREQPVTARRHRTPNTVPVSPCTSGESSASSTTSVDPCSITGRYSNIEEKYHLDHRVLGTGFHGSVRKCINRRTGDVFAVKTIRKTDKGVKPGALAREIRLLREIKHSSIIQLVDVFEDAEHLHLVTDLCEGGELFDKIVENLSNEVSDTPCFAEDEAARIIRQLLEAVSYMHRNNIVHRDIKPENIIFKTTEEGSSIKVVDFGLARKHYERLEPPMATITGTPYYIAPEVLRRSYDKSCDLWSVGVVAYILLAGYPPFNGESNSETHRAVLRGRYHFAKEEWSCISSEARDFVRRLLRMDPRQRMTVEEALTHPWIVRQASVDEGLEFDLFLADAALKDMRVSSRRGSMLPGRVAKRNTRKAMFGI